MSSDRISRRFVLLGLTGLAGCGFAPIYGDDNALTGQVAFDTPNSVLGFDIRDQLQRRLGSPASAPYRLTIRAETRERAATITAQGDNARFNITGAADWALTTADGGLPVTSGRVEAFTSYSASGSTVATQSARDDAQARLAIILADLVVNRLLALAVDGTL